MRVILERDGEQQQEREARKASKITEKIIIYLPDGIINYSQSTHVRYTYVHARTYVRYVRYVRYVHVLAPGRYARARSR